MKRGYGFVARDNEIMIRLSSCSCWNVWAIYFSNTADGPLKTIKRLFMNLSNLKTKSPIGF